MKQTEAERKAIEWLNCKKNPFYFIYNYVYIPEHGTGGKIKLTSENLNPKMKRVIRALYKYHKAILMASRQLGKSSIAACLIAWALVFYPGIQVTILNMKKKAGLQNLATVKFIVNNLPTWMVTNKPIKSRSEIVTYLDLYNDSHLDVFFPSTVHDSSTIARSLTVPILYIDEVGFIKDMVKIYGSAQQTLSKARQQAVKQGYPFFQFLTSTPNGVTGSGEWFYKRWQNCVDSDLLFDEDLWKTDVNLDEIVTDPTRNSFIGIKYHWSEDPSKNEKWYQEQCQEIDDERTINQELDLLFVGTQFCIFTDRTLSLFDSKEMVESIDTPGFAKLNVFEKELDPSDYYLVGCDTAESLEGAFCAIEIFGFRNFNQVAELEHKYGSYTMFGQDIDFTFKWLRNKLGTDNIILCNENNSIGRAPIEYLVLQVKDINYVNYLYVDDIKPRNNKPVISSSTGIAQSDNIGIKTTGMTKPLMVGCLLECVKENPKGFKSQSLINQFSNIEKTNSGSIRSSGYTDLFMAASFCSYVRSKTAIDIMPMLIENNISQYKKDKINEMKDIIGMGNIKSLQQPKNNFNYVDGDFELNSDSDFDEFSDEINFLPFFNA